MINEPKPDGYRYYNQWAGNPDGVRENKKLCAEEVRDTHGWQSHQCTRLRGYGEGRPFCKQHAKQHPVKTACGDMDG